MAKTDWSNSRLQRLYAHYNQKYWSGRLPEYKVINQEIPPEDRAIGLCVQKNRCVIIDVSKHRSDKNVRSTVLHEMAHVAAPKDFHGSSFLGQVEMLLRKGAPIDVGFPEIGSRTEIDLSAIPKRLRLCRRALKRPITRQQRELEREIEQLISSNPPAGFIQVTKEMLAQEFKDAALLHGMTWKKALRRIGRTYAMLDIDDNPLPKFRQWIKAARTAHREGRRLLLDMQRAEEAFSKSAEPKEHLPQVRSGKSRPSR